MAKYKDKNGMGKSKLCPKVKGESEKSGERHARRKSFNLKRFKIIERFCENNNLVFRLLNNGHHWQVESDKKIIEWWPSSAKVVVNKNWKRGIHCHDYEQFIEIIKKEIGAENETDKI